MIGGIWFVASFIFAGLSAWLMIKVHVRGDLALYVTAVIFGAAIGFARLIGLSKRACLLWSSVPGVFIIAALYFFVGIHPHSLDNGMWMAGALVSAFALLTIPLAFSGCITIVGLIGFFRMSS